MEVRLTQEEFNKEEEKKEATVSAIKSFEEKLNSVDLTKYEGEKFSKVEALIEKYREELGRKSITLQTASYIQRLEENFDRSLKGIGETVVTAIKVEPYLSK